MILVETAVLREWLKARADWNDSATAITWGPWPKEHRFCRAIQRPMVSVFLADEMAVSLGLHPVQIWPDWYEFEDAPYARCGGCHRRGAACGFCHRHCSARVLVHRTEHVKR